MEGSSDVEGDLVGEVFEYLLSGKYCDGVSKERKRTIRKKALKFSVSSRVELFYRQKRKGMAITFCSGLSYDTLALASLRANMTVVGLMAAPKIQCPKHAEKHSRTTRSSYRP
ncbi:hypothetical protein EMCRGX_G004274 [Ephydatia muelleri]